MIMKHIQLSQGKFTLVDDDKFELLSQFKWHTKADGNLCYAARTQRQGKKSIKIKMHRLLMGATDSKIYIDHINGDTLDNRMCNLRICTHAENMRNRGKNKNSTSGYKGVHFYKAYQKWQSNIMHERKRVCLGYFDTAEEAAKAYNEAASKLHGEFAYLNEIAA